MCDKCESKTRQTGSLVEWSVIIKIRENGSFIIQNQFCVEKSFLMMTDAIYKKEIPDFPKTSSFLEAMLRSEIQFFH